MMLPDPISALSEILRVLKPNGLSVNITPSSMDFYSFLDDAKSIILKDRGLDPEKNKEYEWSFYNNRAIVQWGRTDAVKKHFSGAGFEEDKLRAEMVEVKVNIDDWRLTISVSVRMMCFIFRSRVLKLTFFVTLPFHPRSSIFSESQDQSWNGILLERSPCFRRGYLLETAQRKLRKEVWA